MTDARLDRGGQTGWALPARPLPLRTVLALLPLVLAGCAQQVMRADGLMNMAPALSVERFLQASNARDFDAMARLFGTPDGPVADTGGSLGCAFKRMGSWIGLADRCTNRYEVELRMAAISDVLRHQDYRIVSEGQEPGRRSLTNRVGVDLTRCVSMSGHPSECAPGGQVIRDVKFLVVRTNEGGWLVQEIELQKVMGS